MGHTLSGVSFFYWRVEMVNMSDVEVGDKIKLRCGRVIEVDRVGEGSSRRYPFRIFSEYLSNNDFRFWQEYTSKGNYFANGEDAWDIIEIIKKDELGNKQC